MKLLSILSLAFATTTFALQLPSKVIKSSAGYRGEESRLNYQNAADGQFPYQVSLLFKTHDDESGWCSGALIDNEWVLTAAYCVDNIQEALVYLGANHHQSVEVTHKINNEHVIVHPDWNKVFLKNNIALVQIPYTDYSDNIQRVKLPSAKSFYGSFEGDEVIISAWDHVSYGFAPNLQSIHMNVIPNSQCRKYYGGGVSSSNICGANSDNVSACIGNIGSPLVLETTKTQIGINSFGSRDGCANGIPAIFTGVAHYLDWIEENSGVSN